MSLREFVKRTAVSATEPFVSAAKRSRAKELARRDRERPHHDGRWLTRSEQQVLTELTALIVPSDASAPGAAEAGVMDVLERQIAASQSRHELYAAGLLGFDELASRKHGRSFPELSKEQRMHLLQQVDLLCERRASRHWWHLSLVGKATLAIKNIPHERNGLRPAADLFPSLTRDVLEAFYTSRTAWDWLGFNGPPFPFGYVDRLNG